MQEGPSPPAAPIVAAIAPSPPLTTPSMGCSIFVEDLFCGETFKGLIRCTCSLMRSASLPAEGLLGMTTTWFSKTGVAVELLLPVLTATTPGVDVEVEVFDNRGICIC